MARSPFIAPLIVGCAQFMHQFDGAVIATALPSMAESLHEDPIRLNLAITCYLLALAVFVPISGWMADRFGAKRIFLAAIVIFTVSSVCCGFVESLPALVVARTIQGIGGAMMTPVGRVIVIRSTAKHQLVQAMNYITIPAVLGPVLGPAVGGFIVTHLSWHWIFFLNLPIGVAGLFLVRAFIPDLREESVPPLDVRGFILVGVALAGLVFGFSVMGRGVLPFEVTAMSVGVGAICGVLYILHARRTPNAIVDLTLLKVRTFATSIYGGCLFYCTTVSSVFVLALMLQVGFGLSAFQAGLITLGSAAGSVLMRFVFRPILRLIGFRRLLITNSLLTGSFLITCGMFTVGTPYLFILGVLFIGGFSRSLQFTSVQSLAYAEIPSSKTSRATSFSAMMQQLAQSLGVAATAFTLHMSMLWHDRTVLTAGDASLAFYALGGYAILSAYIFWRLPAHAGAELTPRARD
jgi:EmrB/QacA subfamily drug resistance transporter